MTGASGNVGQAVALALVARGWRIRALEHRRPVPVADEAVPGSLSDAASLRRGLEGADAVVHLAALTHARRERRYQQVNVEGTRRLIAEARGVLPGRLLHVSTRAVSEDGGGYSRSKRAAERLVSEAPLDTVIVRLPEVYGAGGAEGVDRIIALARAGRPILLPGSGDDEVCPVRLDDAAAAIAAALDAPAASRRTYTLAGECMTLSELAERCVAELGSSSRVRTIPTAMLRIAGTAARLLPLPLYPDQLARLRSPKPPASAEARTDLGFAPLALSEGLRRR